MNSEPRNSKNRRAWAIAACAVVLCIGVAIAYGMASAAASRRPDAAPAATMPPAAELAKVGGDRPLNSELIDYSAFTVSFNNTLRIPNWVSWELTADETRGNLPRGQFKRDDKVSACPWPSDYTGTGYDRGHMAPSADMKWDAQAMKECFYMTNMCPQTHALNGGTWKKLEEKTRLWAQADSSVIIVCGPVLTPRPDEYIGDDEDIAVPKAFFKVICSPYVNPPRAIGFIMPNGRVNGGLQAAAVSVDSVEALTGFDFFAALPDSIENTIEAECRFHLWSTIRPKE